MDSYKEVDTTLTKKTTTLRYFLRIPLAAVCACMCVCVCVQVLGGVVKGIQRLHA